MQTAIDRWFSFVIGKGEANEVFRALALELPPLSSLILDRSCRFQCQHCIFQKESSLRSFPQADSVLHILKQLPNVKVVHEGRQLTRGQLPLLEAISTVGYSIGIIESGTYVPLTEEILQSKLRFDWIDVSVDGPREIHNLQRNSPKAWEIAIEGIRQARRILKPEGKVTSLMTLTSLNCEHVGATGQEVFARGANEWHLTTLSVRKGIEGLRASEKQLEIALKQIGGVSKSQKVFLRIYNLEDMRALISIFGEKAFSNLLKDAKVTQNALVLDIGFPLFFYPASLAPGETLVIDADGWWRLPYCIKYTLDELRKGRNACEHDISVFSVAEITERTDVVGIFPRVVSGWRRYSGEEQLIQERALLQKLF